VIRRSDILVFPAASRPSISSRISLDPKILAIIFDIDAPILSVLRYLLSYGFTDSTRRNVSQEAGGGVVDSC
jgi:hypothetical protein